MYTWDQSIRYVIGVGPTKAKALARFGIHTVGDLLDHRPLYYIYGTITPIADVSTEGHVIIQGTIKSIHRLPTHMPIVEATIEDESGQYKARWYNQQNALSALRPGMVVWMWSKVSKGVLQQPRWSTVEPDWSGIQGGFYGKYNQTIRSALREVLTNINLPDLWEGSSRSMVYSVFHFPETEDEQQTAEHYLRVDELCQLMWAMKQVRDRQARKRGVVICI